MGISVLCVFDGRTNSFKYFDDHNKKEFLENYYLNSECCLISYNGLLFDNKVIEKTWFTDLPEIPGPEKVQKKAQEIDILSHIWSGLNSNAPGLRFHKGCKLTEIAESTIGQKKCGDALMAPELFQTHRFAELYTYCSNDVKMTWDLAMFIKEHGYVTSPIKGEITLDITFP